jgi:hypothetical protein
LTDAGYATTTARGGPETKSKLAERETYLDKHSSANELLEAVAVVLFGHILPRSDPQSSFLRRLRSLVRSKDKAADRGSNQGGSG